MDNKSLFILGLPGSGKTVFAIQFYNRLIKNKSFIKLYDSVKNISLIAEARAKLSKGELPEPTSADKFSDLNLPLQVGEQRLNLIYPDFGGEQIHRIYEERAVDKNWSKNLKKSSNWLLFIKLLDLKRIDDSSNFTIEKERLKQDNADIIEFEISDQSKLIELLQILLDIKNNDSHYKNSSINLSVILTCWDEIDTKETPITVFNKFLPLLLNFIENSWEDSNIKVFGLSALGFDLISDKHKQKYIDEGAENFGYFVDANGNKDDDMTQLISEVIK